MLPEKFSHCLSEIIQGSYCAILKKMVMLHSGSYNLSIRRNACSNLISHNSLIFIASFCYYQGHSLNILYVEISMSNTSSVVATIVSANVGVQVQLLQPTNLAFSYSSFHFFFFFFATEASCLNPILEKILGPFLREHWPKTHKHALPSTCGFLH